MERNSTLNDIPLVEDYVINVSEKYPKLGYLKELILKKREVEMLG